jgi:hypothetical protein
VPITPFSIPAHRTGRADFGIRLSDWFHRMAHGSSSNASVLHGSGSEIRLRLAIELPLKDPDLSGVSGSSPITRSSPSSKAHQKSGAFPPPELPGFFGTMSLSDSRRCRRPNGGVEAATLAAAGPPRYPDHLPDVPCPLPRRIERVRVSILPRPRGLPRFAGGSASTTSLSRPAQASLTLRPARLLNRPRRPLSRGFDPASYPTKPLVSYQTYRLLSGWILPPPVIRAFAGHTA